MIGWTADPDRYESFGSLLKTVAGLGRSILVLRCNRDLADAWFPPEGSIDVWWRGRENGSLMLLLAHLLAQSDQWRNRKIRLLRAIRDESGYDAAMQHLEELIDVSRINAEPVVIVSNDVCHSIQDVSGSAGVVFLGFKAPETGEESNFVDSMNHLCGDLQTVVFVSSAGGVELSA